MTRLAILNFALLLAAHAVARDIYVDNVAGDDRSDGGATTNVSLGHGPFHSIQRALCDALPGDHIVLAKTDRPYRECVSLVGSRLSGLCLDPLVIEGNGAVLDGSRRVRPGAWEFVSGDVFRFQPRRMQFQQLFLDGAPCIRRPWSQLEGKPLELEPLQWALVDGWIHFRGEHGKLPQDYNLTYAVLPTGLTLYKVEYVVIQNLVVQGYAIDGVNLNDVKGPSILAGLTSRGNGRSGIAIIGATQADIRGCLVGDNGHAQIYVEGPSEANLSNSDILDNTAPASEVRDGGSLLVNGKPSDTQ